MATNVAQQPGFLSRHHVIAAILGVVVALVAIPLVAWSATEFIDLLYTYPDLFGIIGAVLLFVMAGFMWLDRTKT